MAEVAAVFCSVLTRKLVEKGILSEEDAADILAGTLKRVYPNLEERKRVWKVIVDSVNES